MMITVTLVRMRRALIMTRVTLCVAVLAHAQQATMPISGSCIPLALMRDELILYNY